MRQSVGQKPQTGLEVVGLVIQENVLNGLETVRKFPARKQEDADDEQILPNIKKFFGHYFFCRVTKIQFGSYSVKGSDKVLARLSALRRAIKFITSSLLYVSRVLRARLSFSIQYCSHNHSAATPSTPGSFRSIPSCCSTFFKPPFQPTR